MSGLEPLTYALRMGTTRMTKVIDNAIINFLATDSDALGTSAERRFVLDNPIRPDWYSQMK
jgi:hypothetical protein